MRWRTRCARPRSGSAATGSRSTWSTHLSWPSRCGEPWAEQRWPTDSIRLQIASHTLEALVPDPVVVEELTKTYPGGVHAVRGISFSVRPGEVFGLLGPNGAGKTTTIGVLTTLVRPTGGRALVGGHDVVADPLAARGSIGVVFQESVLDNEFSGLANLRLHARLWRVPDPDARIASLLDAVGLTERASHSVRTYSGGMRRPVENARAPMARPSVLFLDEPTLGLDPIVRQALWQTVRALREREEVTVLLSTHYLEEAETVCERVAIVDRGEIVALDRPASLIAPVGRNVLELRVDG